MNNIESLYSLAVREFRQQSTLVAVGESMSTTDQDFHFGMRCNGYFLLENGDWAHNRNSTTHFVREFTGQNVTFFGPNPYDKFFSGENIAAGFTAIARSFDRQPVIDTIGKYREIDENLAARIAFIFGGVARHFTAHEYSPDEIADTVEYVARMTALGERRSGDAIASAMAMYAMSGGPLQLDRQFTGATYHMADAIKDDPIRPSSTIELGLSQTARLKAYDRNIKRKEWQPFPDISQHLEVFAEFPTVGAEFHFPINAPQLYPNFWHRVATLNMSQYQRGSYVQFSRNDRNVIELRMNPSIYPVTVANWNYMKKVFPELEHTFFTITLNRTSGGDFAWSNSRDKDLLASLRALGMLGYAAMFKDIPRRERAEEIDFGAVYLGQTVKMSNGTYDFSGNWSGGEGQYGQFGIYAGYGDNLPYLAYYLSMALTNPNVFGRVSSDYLRRVRTLQDALRIDRVLRGQIHGEIQNHITILPKLNQADRVGKEVFALLTEDHS